MINDVINHRSKYKDSPGFDDQFFAAADASDRAVGLHWFAHDIASFMNS
jgi:hypothetical protein